MGYFDSEEFFARVSLDELCKTASRLRGGISCTPGKHERDDTHVLLTITFSDSVRWLARILYFSDARSIEDCELTYIATLRFLKARTSLPVPRVFHWALKSQFGNGVGATYVLMERMPGKRLSGKVQEIKRMGDQKAKGIARKLHRQVAAMVMELSTHQFSRIGSLKENPWGHFYVGPYSDILFTEFHPSKRQAYAAMPQVDHGPWASVTEYYDSMTRLSATAAEADAEQQAAQGRNAEPQHKIAAQYRLLREMAPKFVDDRFARGPFVLGHSEINVYNVLVDENYNITALFDFPGTTVPLPSLLIPPSLFYDTSLRGALADRDLYRHALLAAAPHTPPYSPADPFPAPPPPALYCPGAPNPDALEWYSQVLALDKGPLADADVRKELVCKAEVRGWVEMSMQSQFLRFYVKKIFDRAGYGREYDEEKELARVMGWGNWGRARNK